MSRGCAQRVAGIAAAITAAVAVTLPAKEASACSRAEARVVCGLSIHGWHPGETAPGEIPRNVAVRKGCEVLDAEGRPVELVPVEGPLELARPAMPLEPGTRATAGLEATVTDVIDEEAPGQVRIAQGVVEFVGDPPRRGCRSPNCGGHDEMVLEVEAPEDDHAAPQDLTYAIYLGDTEERARTADEPVVLLAPDPEGVLRRMHFWEEPFWVSIRAIDLAGNAGPRSEPIEVRRAKSGCATSGRSVTGWIGVSLLLLVVSARRAQRFRRRATFARPPA